MTEKKYSRRKWLKHFSQLLGAPLLFLWYKATRQAKRISAKRKVFLPAEISGEIMFLGDVILTRSADGMQIFSAHCTHLGCIIDQQQNGVMICPCHGSRFSTEGHVLNGPAGRPLQRLTIFTDGKNGRKYVKIQQ